MRRRCLIKKTFNPGPIIIPYEFTYDSERETVRGNVYVDLIYVVNGQSKTISFPAYDDGANVVAQQSDYKSVFESAGIFDGNTLKNLDMRDFWPRSTSSKFTYYHDYDMFDNIPSEINAWLKGEPLTVAKVQKYVKPDGVYIDIENNTASVFVNVLFTNRDFNDPDDVYEEVSLGSGGGSSNTVNVYKVGPSGNLMFMQMTQSNKQVVVTSSIYPDRSVTLRLNTWVEWGNVSSSTAITEAFYIDEI